MGDIKFTLSLVFISLFTIGVIGYALNFGIDNNASVKLGDDPSLNKLTNSINGNVSVVTNNINSSSTGFFSSEVDSGDTTTKTGGSFKLGLFGIISMFSAVLTTIRLKLFGGSPALSIFITMFGAMMTYIAIRYIWKTWKGGNPD